MSYAFKKTFSFSQLFSLGDLKNVGNCYAYVILMLTYINMSKLILGEEKLNYDALHDFFSAINSNERKILNDSQSTYLDEGRMFAFLTALLTLEPGLSGEIAVIASQRLAFTHDFALLNDTKINANFSPTAFFDQLAEDIDQFKDPLFYVLNLYDPNQKFLSHEISHCVSVYLTSKHQLHVFDPNSGAYIIDLPDKLIPSELKTTIFDIVFQKNFAFRWFYKADSPTLFTSFFTVIMNPELNERQKNILHVLRKFCDNPTQQVEHDSPCMDEKNVKFVNLNKLALQCLQQHQNLKQDKKILENLTNHFTSFFHCRGFSDSEETSAPRNRLN